MTNMKVAVFEALETIVCREVKIPTCEKDGILVKVMACGICGGDIRNFKQGLRHGVKSQIMGHEVAGEVVQVGSEVEQYKPGDRVALAPDVSCGSCYYCKRGLVNLCQDHKMLGTHWPGGFAQYIYLPKVVLERGFVEPIPESMSYYQATIAEPASSVIACQQENNVQIGDTVVVIGAGPIGCMHCEVAKARGAKQVILIGRKDLSYLKEKFDDSIDYIINTKEVDPVEEVLRLTESIGADMVICANPSVETQQTAVEMSRKRGKVILFGGVPKANPYTTLDSNKIHYQEISVIGSFSYPSTGLESAISYIESGIISADKYITKVVKLDDVQDAVLHAKQLGNLKTIIDPWK